VFEIASITKVFTTLLLADMALRAEVRLDDPVARHLPGDFTGYALLSMALAHRGGKPYETLLRTRVLEPMGL